MDLIRGHLDAEGSVTVQAALAPLMQRRPAQDGVRDPRSPARRCADALVALSERALSAGGLPTVAGERPPVTVTMPLADLQAGIRHGTFNTGTPISPESARRMACDASVIPMALGSQASRWISVDKAGPSGPGSAEPSWPETLAACIPIVTLQRRDARSTTSGTGPTQDPPPSAT
jgi:hypothetical protein